MNWIVDLLPLVGVPGDVIGWVVVLVDVAIKSVLVLGVTAAVAFGLRGASAALRHQVWAVALGGLLMLPVLSIVLPHWQLAFLPAFDTVIPVPQVVPNSEPAGTRAFVPATAIQFEPVRES